MWTVDDEIRDELSGRGEFPFCERRASFREGDKKIQDGIVTDFGVDNSGRKKGFRRWIIWQY